MFGGSEDAVDWIRPMGGRAALNRLLVKIGSMKPAEEILAGKRGQGSMRCCRETLLWWFFLTF